MKNESDKLSFKFNRKLYGKNWRLWHNAISIVIIFLILIIMKICNIPFKQLLFIINADTISLSASIAGFVFAGMSILISMNKNEKMHTLNRLEKDDVIYNILISSILSFTISLLLMFIDINALRIDCIVKVVLIQQIMKTLVEIVSMYLFLLGFIFFFSSLKLIYWILN